MKLDSTTIWIAIVLLCRASDGLLFADKPRINTLDRIFQSGISSPSLSGRKRHQATKDDTETWSKAIVGRRESRLGVRRRVREVLRRARERTGVLNDSELLNSDSALGLEATTTTSSKQDAMMDFGINADLLRVDASLSLGGLGTLGADFDDFEMATPTNGFATPQTKGGLNIATTNTLRNGASDSTALLGTQQDVAKVDPLPFNLPTLSKLQKEMLVSGERVQEQSRMGGEGTGFVVMDIPAPEYAVWECLLDFEAYPQNIGTVRSMRMFTSTHLKQSYYAETPLPPRAVTRHYGKASISRAVFVLSKFRLNIAAVHKYVPHPDGHYMVFTLDRATKNAVLQDAKGIWYTESDPDGLKGITRVWLLCELSVSPYFPTFIVDYAAKRAMPRATTWLPETVRQFMQKLK